MIFASVVLLIFFAFVGVGDVNVHGDAACDIRLCFSSYVPLLSYGGVGVVAGDVG